MGIRCRVCVGEAGSRRDDDPATVDYLREQAPYSQYNGYSMRRDRCSFGRTLQEGNRMTICSWSMQSPERPLNFVRPHAKLRKSKARCATTSVLWNRYSALCQRLKSSRSTPRDDTRSIPQIHLANNGEVSLELGAYNPMCCSHQFIGKLSTDGSTLQGDFPPGSNQNPHAEIWTKVHSGSCVDPTTLNRFQSQACPPGKN
jgi:hypothetical protein